MRKTGLAALLASVLILAAASMGYAQSAEDFVKGQSRGIRYANRFNDDGIPTVNVLYLRGDTLTDVTEEGRSKGFYRTISIVSKRSEGNKLILDDGNVEYIVDAYRLVERPKNGAWGAGIVYMREE